MKRRSTNEKTPVAAEVNSQNKDLYKQDSSVVDGEAQERKNENKLVRFDSVWAAPITPPSCKAVLVALTWCANKDGTGIYPSIAKVAGMCSLSPNSVRVHIAALCEMGVIRLTEEATPRKPATYALDFVGLAGIQSAGGLKPRRTPTHKFEGYGSRASGLQPTGGLKGIEASSPRASGLQPTSVRPPADWIRPGITRVSPGLIPGGGGVPSGDGLAPVPSGPLGVDAQSWNVWVKRSGWSNAELQDRVKEGEALMADGYDINAMLAWLLDVAKDARRSTYKRWPAPTPEFKLDKTGSNRKRTGEKKASRKFAIPTGTPEQQEAAYLGVAP
jgi:hypothetical protein